MPGVITITHAFVSQLADSPDAVAAGELVPSNWNDDHVVTGAAPLDSPAFTGTPTAPTPGVGDTSDKIATMAALAVIAVPARVVLTAPGPYAVADGIALVVVKQTVPALMTVVLPLSTDVNAPDLITVKDRGLAAGAGSGASSYNITVLPSGAEVIDGNSQAVLDVDNQAMSFRKVRNNAGAITGEGYEIM
jgi:hypothetical protein